MCLILILILDSRGLKDIDPGSDSTFRENENEANKCESRTDLNQSDPFAGFTIEHLEYTTPFDQRSTRSTRIYSTDQSGQIFIRNDSNLKIYRRMMNFYSEEAG